MPACSPETRSICPDPACSRGCRHEEPSIECFECGGSGARVELDVRPTCCGHFTRHGECRGHCAVPEQYEERVQCDMCGGAGRIYALTVPIVGTVNGEE